MSRYLWSSQYESVNFKGTIDGADAASEEDANKIVLRHNREIYKLLNEIDDQNQKINEVLELIEPKIKYDEIETTTDRWEYAARTELYNKIKKILNGE